MRNVTPRARLLGGIVAFIVAFLVAFTLSGGFVR
jgi:hypothetical protein